MHTPKEHCAFEMASLGIGVYLQGYSSCSKQPWSAHLDEAGGRNHDLWTQVTWLQIKFCHFLT